MREMGRTLAARCTLSWSVLDLNTLSLPDLYTELARTGFIRRLLELARDEDLGPIAAEHGCGLPNRRWLDHDVTSAAGIEPRITGAADLVARQACTVAGLATIPELLEVFGTTARWTSHAADGERVAAGTCLGRLDGPLAEILSTERTILNIVARLSGVATRTAEFVAQLDGLGAQLLDTRKTTPGMRVLEKYAVRCGGGFCHRIGLYDALLIKDNHIAGIPPDRLAAVVRAAVDRARGAVAKSGGAGGLRFAEVEVDSLDQLRALLAAGGAGTDIILLDNMSVAMLRDAVRLRNQSGARVLLEASGGVRLDTVRALAETGVDRISVGGLTHQAVSIDLGLDVV